MVDHRCWNAGDAVFRQWTRTRSWTQARQVRRVGDIDSDGRVEQHAPQMRCGSRAGRAKGYLGLVSGRRWWFVCPKTAKRVSKVYMPPGAVTFASRGAHRLAYKSQRETPFARACSRACAVAWATTRASAPPSRSHQACAGGRLIASWRKSRPLKAWPCELAGKVLMRGTGEQGVASCPTRPRKTTSSPS